MPSYYLENNREEFDDWNVLLEFTNTEEKKKKGIRGFFNRTWKAIKRPFIHKPCVETSVPPPLPETQLFYTDPSIPNRFPKLVDTEDMMSHEDTENREDEQEVVSDNGDESSRPTETSITGPALTNEIPESPDTEDIESSKEEQEIVYDNGDESSSVVSIQYRLMETVENSPQEPRKKTKKTRICRFIRRAWKAVKRPFRHHRQIAKLNQTAEPLCFEPSNGDLNDQYLVGRELGSGGFGEVNKGTCISNGQKVAIKTLYKEDGVQQLFIPGHSEPLPAEVALLLMMSKPPISPKVVQIFKWFDGPSSIQIVMEYPRPTITLQKYMAKKNILSESTARVLISQAALAISDCIAHGVYNSDIHPGNFLINPKTLDLKMIDFNCGQVINEDGYTPDQFGGVPYYCPPEVIKKGTFHAVPANVWQVGLILGEMVNGYLPYNIRTFKYLRFNPSVSRDCREVISQCLNPNPSERPGLLKILKHKWFVKASQS